MEFFGCCAFKVVTPVGASERLTMRVKRVLWKKRERSCEKVLSAGRWFRLVV